MTKAYLGVTVPAAVKDALQAEALRLGVTMTDLVNEAILEDLKSRGISLTQLQPDEMSGKLPIEDFDEATS